MIVSTRIFTDPAGLVKSRSWKEKKSVPERSTPLLDRRVGWLVHATLVGRHPNHAVLAEGPVHQVGVDREVLPVALPRTALMSLSSPW